MAIPIITDFFRQIVAQAIIGAESVCAGGRGDADEGQIAVAIEVPDSGVLQPTKAELLEICVNGNDFLWIAIQQTDGTSTGGGDAQRSSALQTQGSNLGT